MQRPRRETGNIALLGILCLQKIHTFSRFCVEDLSVCCGSLQGGGGVNLSQRQSRLEAMLESMTPLAANMPGKGLVIRER